MWVEGSQGGKGRGVKMSVGGGIKMGVGGRGRGVKMGGKGGEGELRWV